MKKCLAERNDCAYILYMKTTPKTSPKTPVRFFIQRISVPFAKPYWNLYERMPVGLRFIQEFSTKRAALAALRSTGQI